MAGRIGSIQRIVDHIAVQIETLWVGWIGKRTAAGVADQSGVINRPRLEASYLAPKLSNPLSARVFAGTT